MVIHLRTPYGIACGSSDSNESTTNTNRCNCLDCLLNLLSGQHSPPERAKHTGS